MIATPCHPRPSARRRGTSLVELLVVIVVLLIGILGVIQVFPGGFGVLRTTRGNTIATELSRQESDRLKGYNWQLPEEIRAVRYSLVGAALVAIAVDPTITMNTFLPDGVEMTPAGIVRAGGPPQGIGYWAYVSGANLMRRVIGEGGPVPAPRQVGAQYGGLLVLQFSPIAYDPAYPLLLQVYGNDLVRRWGDPGFGRVRDWQYFIEDPDTSTARMYIPRHRTKQKSYRLEMTAWFNNPGAQYVDIETQITIPANPSGGYEAIDVSTIPALAPYGTFVGVEFASVRLARLYDQVANSSFFTDDPYEFVLLDQRLGTMLFNPVGYNYEERRQGQRRIPLVARVNYDVFDWRIIRDEFRVPEEPPYQQKLQLGSLKSRTNSGPDNLPWNGLEVPIPDGVGGFRQTDVILLDLDTGGTYLHDPTYPPDPSPEPGVVNDYLMVDPARSSYAVDKTTGFIRFRDADRNAPGLQLRLILPGNATPTIVNAEGRRVRALYQAFGEWAVQVMKSPSRFRLTYGGPQRAEYYIGGTGVPGGQPTRIYFPATDAGKNVTIGEIWYQDGGGNRLLMTDQNFTIQTAPFDPLGPYVDIRNLDPSAVAFDFSNGYAVRYVRGASLIVRTVWNPAYFALGNDWTDNWTQFVQWSRNWRKGTVETYLQRGAN